MSTNKHPRKDLRPQKQVMQGTYWLYGQHAVIAALGNKERQIHRAVATAAAAETLASYAKRRNQRVEILEGAQLQKYVGAEAVHQGMALSVSALPEASLHEVITQAEISAEKRPFLLLDQVTDPHNIGAILRSAAAFHAVAVVVTRHHAPQEGAVMAKAASGALEVVPYIQVGNLSQAMEQLKQAGYWIAGMDGEAKVTLKQAKLSAATALVMGAEGAGLRRLTRERCDLLVKLPMSRAMESLNVSNASAIALYELYSYE